MTNKAPLNARLQYLWIEYRALALAGFFFLILSVCYLIFYRPEPNRHDGYVLAEVQSTMDMTDDLGDYDVRAVVTLPDGQSAVIRARNVAQAQWLISTVCVERRLSEGGKVRHWIAAPDKCKSQ